MTRTLRLLLVLSATFMAIVAAPGSASAHSGKQSYVYFSFYDTEIDGRIEFPLADLGPAIGIDIPGDARSARPIVLANLAAIQAYADEHLTIGDGTETWEVTFEGFGLLPLGERSYVQLPFEVEQTFDPPPREISISYDAIIESDPEKDAIILVENDWRSATFNEEANEILFYSVGATDQVLVLEDASTLESMGGVRGLASEAFRTSSQQLLLAIALMLPLGLMVAGRSLAWPAPTARAATSRLAKVLGVYALAHSVTIWSTGLGITQPSGRAVGILLGTAIVVAAGWALTTARRPALARGELAIAAGVGLVSGLELGRMFVDFQLDRTRIVLSLIAWNVGVEVGLAVLAAVVFSLLLLLRRTVLASLTLYASAVVIGLYGLAWAGEGLTERNLRMEELGNPLHVWPRNLVIMLVVIAAAGGLYAWQASRGRLRPVDGGGGAPVERTPAPTEVLSS